MVYEVLLTSIISLMICTADVDFDPKLDGGTEETGVQLRIDRLGFDYLGSVFTEVVKENVAKISINDQSIEKVGSTFLSYLFFIF